VPNEKESAACTQNLKRCQEPILGRDVVVLYSGCMGRPQRAAEGGYVYHVLNRANARMMIIANRRDLVTSIRDASNRFLFRRTINCLPRPVMSNAMPCGRMLSPRAEDWRWGSLFRWARGSADDRRLLAAWPMPRPANWLEHVNARQTDAELAALRRCVNRGSPYGAESWCERTIRSLGLESTIRPRGRPKKQNNGS